MVLGYNSHALPMSQEKGPSQTIGGGGHPMKMAHCSGVEGMGRKPCPRDPAHSLGQSSPLSSNSYGNVPEKSLESSGLARKCHTRRGNKRETMKTTG